jgi:hypothetical protein
MKFINFALFLFSLINAQVLDDNNKPEDNNIPRPGDDRPVLQAPVVTSTSATATSSTVTATSSDDSKPTNGGIQHEVGALGLLSFFAYAVF